MLHSPSTRAERDLFFGEMGTGKTNAAFSLLELSLKTESPSRFFWLDTDGVADIYGVRDLAIVYDVEKWGDFNTAMDNALERVYRKESDWDPTTRPLDWLVVDRNDRAWEWVRNEWIKRKMGKTMDAFFEDTVADAYEDVNWNQINAWYNEYMQKVIRWPGHVLVTAGEKDVSVKGSWADDQKVQRDFRQGKKPQGQGDLPYQMHSVLWFQEPRQDAYTVTTIKELRREKVKGLELGNWTLSYLVGVAGWEL